MWTEWRLHNYSFDYSIYAGYPGRPVVRIDIRADSVFRVTQRTDNAVLPVADWPTMDGVFAFIANQITAGNGELRVQYNSLIGYPILIETNPHVGDGGVDISVENFTAN